jgi:hypothetical protein
VGQLLSDANRYSSQAEEKEATGTREGTVSPIYDSHFESQDEHGAREAPKDYLPVACSNR